MDPVSNKTLLAKLNSFRAIDGLPPYKDWRASRHQPMLDAYIQATLKMVEESEGDLPSYKQFARYEKSAIVHPVDFIHTFLAEHGDKMTRKEAVHHLVTREGINYSTARTQYQRWFAGHKKVK